MDQQQDSGSPVMWPTMKTFTERETLALLHGKCMSMPVTSLSLYSIHQMSLSTMQHMLPPKKEWPTEKDLRPPGEDLPYVQ